MPLSSGEQLGHYQILSLIGKGGMGEVYRAHDSRVGRDVALKTSAAQFGERVNAPFGASFPLFAAPDRTFDVQYGLRLNYMFGRSAQTGAPFMGGR